MVVGAIALALGEAVAGALYMRKSAKTDDEDEFERLDAFAQADRTFEDEVALARTERNTAVQGKKDS